MKKQVDNNTKYKGVDGTILHEQETQSNGKHTDPNDNRMRGGEV